MGEGESSPSPGHLERITPSVSAWLQRDVQSVLAPRRHGSPPGSTGASAPERLAAHPRVTRERIEIVPRNA